MLIHDLDFAKINVLDEKNDTELYESITLIEIIIEEAEEIIKQINSSLMRK